MLRTAFSVKLKDERVFSNCRYAIFYTPQKETSHEVAHF